jgi:hypothetical protein
MNRLKRYGRAAATTLSAQAVNLLVPGWTSPAAPDGAQHRTIPAAQHRGAGTRTSLWAHR